ncbi:hypothetical protein ATKI12_8498 [Kitasatospora sp. Ki12]
MTADPHTQAVEQPPARWLFSCPAAFAALGLLTLAATAVCGPWVRPLVPWYTMWPLLVALAARHQARGHIGGAPPASLPDGA